MRALLPCLVALALLVLIGCPPSLNRNQPRPDDDDDSGPVLDDDDTTASHDVCCDIDGDGGTWQDCMDGGAADCVCDQDPWCCEGGWDGTCRDLYLSPCGALTCIE
jgi:hypothetical protein